MMLLLFQQFLFVDIVKEMGGCFVKKYCGWFLRSIFQLYGNGMFLIGLDVCFICGKGKVLFIILSNYSFQCYLVEWVFVFMEGGEQSVYFILVLRVQFKVVKFWFMVQEQVQFFVDLFVVLRCYGWVFWFFMKVKVWLVRLKVVSVFWLCLLNMQLVLILIICFLGRFWSCSLVVFVICGVCLCMRMCLLSQLQLMF